MKTYSIFIILLFIAGVIVSCDDNSRNDKHLHEHDEKIYLTAYSSEYEVYIIATPFVAGQTANILTHITLLEDFKPLTEGRVTANLSFDNDSVSQTLTAPTHPGIFEFQIQPFNIGTAELSLKIETAGDVSVVKMLTVEVYDNTEDAYHDAHHESSEITDAGGNTARFPKEQSWKADFSTEQAEQKLIGRIIRSVGQIRNTPEDVRIVSSAMDGIIQFTGGSLFEGNEVRSGQSLFRIDGSAMADNNLSVRSAETESEYNRAKAEYERKEQLAAERIVSESELNQALAEYRRAEANYNNLRNNFSEGSQSVISPVSGYINELLVENGQYVNAGEPVMSISRNQRLIIQTEIPSKYFNELDKITSVNFRMVNGDQTYSLDETGGRIIAYGRSVNLQNPLITLTMELGNDSNLFPGSMVELFMKTEGNLPVITVPDESVIEEMGNYFVYVQLTPEMFEKRPVEKGVTDGRRTEIKKGVSAGERVAGRGALLLKLSQSAGSVDVHSGHVH